MVLDVRSISKMYRQGKVTITAVRNVSLAIAAGEVLAFLGPNGAGKTTTIKMIAGLIRPDGGEVRLAGRDPHRHTHTLRQLGAVLEGNRNLYWRLTPLENLEYFGVLRGLDRRTAHRRARSLLERFELVDKRDAVVQNLSRGMQQKLAIAIALIHDPKLLLLDEPTLGLDVEATQTVKGLIRAIAAEGRALLLTTHQLDIAEELSDRVAIINRGEIVAEEATADLIRQFSGMAYRIELEVPLEGERIGKVESLGGRLDGATIHVGEAHDLYAILHILQPLPLVRIEKDQANLTDVFLRLVGNRQAGEG